MKSYNVESHIRTTADVEQFFRYLIEDEKVNFHPDDNFHDYIDMDTRQKSFSDAECSLYNRLMGECFDACAKEGVEIYGIALDVFSEKVGFAVNI